MANNIFLDFDGTLIDSRIRVYVLFKQLALEINPHCARKIPVFSLYWARKRTDMRQADILTHYLGFSKDNVVQFASLWLERIEDTSLLQLDTPFDGVESALKQAAKKNSLHLVTARQFTSRVKEQLSSFGWISLFASILVTEQRENKADLIRTHIPTFSKNDFFIGDTGEDMRAALDLGIRPVAVDCGFTDCKKMKKYALWGAYLTTTDFLLKEAITS